MPRRQKAKSMRYPITNQRHTTQPKSPKICRLSPPSEVVELRERKDEYGQRPERDQSAQPRQAKTPDQIRFRRVPFPVSLRPGVQVPDDCQDRERQSHQRYQTQQTENKATER